ncbi:putative gustatory receptor 28b [Athalia rosae]|uniref:putative gustatory receptor 28b n=1 Tax=Athalia rosae TaxID=37344 RepID=UPI002034444F|nr:putative gustatory receptor 28b [Athalia rosae]
MFFRPKTLLDSLKPLIFLNCWTGLGTLDICFKNRYLYNLAIIYVILVDVMNSTLAMIGVWFVSQRLYSDTTITSSSIGSITYGVVIGTNSLHSFVAPLLVWLQGKALRNLCRRMSILDAKFQAALGVQIQDEYRERVILLTFQVVAICIIMSLAVAVNFWWTIPYTSGLSFFVTTPTLLQPVGFILTLNLNLYTLLRYLENKLKDLNNGVLNLAEETYIPPNPTREISWLEVPHDILQVRSCRKQDKIQALRLIVEKNQALREIRKLHLEICKLSEEINSCFGAQNLLTVGTSFIIITGLLYTIYRGVTLNQQNHVEMSSIIPLVTWLLFYIFRIWAIPHYSWIVGNEAKKTQQVIYELLRSHSDEILQKEIQQFSVQMLQNSISFNACGFFNLDYTFIQGVIGTITTYLIILIQLNPVNQRISYSAINSTKF